LASPEASSVFKGQPFVQTLSGCSQPQTRTATKVLVNQSTGEIKTTTSSQEHRVLADYSYDQQAVGTSLTECRYISQGSRTVWSEKGLDQNSAGDYGTGIYWNGDNFGTATYSVPVKKPLNFFDNGGYRYTRGVYQGREATTKGLSFFHYAICRTPI
jgi:hypothetical protein